MRKIDKIEFDKSIEKHRLIYKGSLEDRFHTFIILLFCCSFVFISILLNVSAIIPHSDRLLELMLSTLVIIICCYVIFRRITEKQLIEIKTRFDRQANKKILLDYLALKNFKSEKDMDDYLIFHEEHSSFGNNSYGKSIIFLFKDNVVYFTILNSGHRIDLPVLISHIYLKHELRKRLA